MSQHSLVTIGITCFNAADTISRAVQSAFAQDWKNIEVIVVDDHSTDESVIRLEQEFSSDPRFHLVKHQLNTGVAGARNTVIKESSGDFIAFFDDDDFSLSDRVTQQISSILSFEKRLGSRLLACFASGVRRYGNGYELPMPAIGSQGDGLGGEDIVDYLLFNKRYRNYFYGAGTPACALMARREVFEALDNFDAEFRRVEDVDLMIRLGLEGGFAVGCREVLYIQTHTSGNDKTPDKNYASESRLVEKYKTYLTRKGKYDYSSLWFSIRHLHFSKQKVKFMVSLVIFLMRYPITGTLHILRSSSRRWLHERRMS